MRRRTLEAALAALVVLVAGPGAGQATAAGTVEFTEGFALVEADTSVHCPPQTSEGAGAHDEDRVNTVTDFEAEASAASSSEGLEEECGVRASASARQQTTVSGGGGGLTVTSSGFASGTASGESNEDSDFESESFNGNSRVSFGFRVTGEPVAFSMTGSHSGLRDAGFFSQGVVGDPRPGRPNLPEGFSISGVLPPGDYSVRAQAQCTNVPSGTTVCPEARYGLTIAVGGAADTDGDALPNSWETEGIDLEDDGIIDADLPGMGASPNHKDIFIEIDSMPGHVLAQPAIDKVVAAFAAAPVANPDGLPGIALHVDNGPTSTLSGGQTWGSLSEAGMLAHQAVIGGASGNAYDWSAFDAVKQSNLTAARRLAFHYVISGHRYGSAANNSSGISRNGSGAAFGLGASDLLVTLGPASEPGEGSGTVDQQAGTLMHELGHNLALRHGGSDDVHYKPSYLSVMNYAFQFTGLRRADGTFQFDYSRTPISLDESALDEDAGFGFAAASEQAQYLTMVLCPGSPLPEDGGRLFVENLVAGPLDWDCDGLTQGQVGADVNGDGQLSSFTSFLDWPALVYGGGSIGAGGASVVLPQTTEMTEPQLEELLANQESLEQGVRKPTTDPATPGQTSPGPTTPGGTGTQAQALEPLVLRGRVVRVSGSGRFRLRLANPNAVTLNGKLTIDMRVPSRRQARGGAARRLVLASRRFQIAAGGSTRVALRLRPVHRRLLTRRGRLSVRAKVSAGAPGGPKQTATRRLTLRAA